MTIEDLRRSSAKRLRRVLPQVLAVRLWRQFLTDTGWTRTVRSQIPEDRDGRALPWFTYPAISLLGERVRPEFRVFEYGSGQSTLWWADQVSSVVAVEHDAVWATRVRERAPANVTVLQEDRGPGYQQAPLDSGGQFDIVVVDGRDRVACARYALDALSDTGVVVWDNADVAKYSAGIDLIRSAGYRRLDLTGLGPVNTSQWTTAVLYRPTNCLDI